MAEPERVDRLVLGAFTYKGDNSPTLTERAKNLDYYRTHNRRLRDRDMIRSIFTRDKPGTTDPAIAEFLADEELKFGDQVPTGTYLDMTANLPRGGSEDGDRAGAAGARRVRRHRHHERSDRFLHAAPQRRPPVRDSAGNGAFGGAGPESPDVLARDARVPVDAGNIHKVEL